MARTVEVKSLLPPRYRTAIRAIQAWHGGEAELRLLPRLCRPDAWAIDVGANHGVYTWHLWRLSAGVMAFEPQPGMARKLRTAFGKGVVVEQVALSDRDDEMRLRVPQGGGLDGCATIEPANRLDGHPSVETRVACRRLDSYPLGRVACMKVDVEGHELAVLRGAGSLLARDRPHLIVESEDRHRPRAVGDLVEWLGSFGYRGFYLADGRPRDLARLGARGDGNLGRQAAERGVYNFIFTAEPELLFA